MKLNEVTALRAYARMLNTLDVQPLEHLLAEDFTYESQMILEPIESKKIFLDYIVPKLETIASSDTVVFAEMGSVVGYGRQQPCVILAQYDKSNLVGIVLAKVTDDKLRRLDLCIVPSPEAAERSGEYPT